MRLRTLAIVTSVVAILLTVFGFYVDKQYRNSRSDVLPPIRTAPWYDLQGMADITALPGDDGARYCAQARAAMLSVTPDDRIHSEFFYVEATATWSRVVYLSSLVFTRHGFTKVTDSTTGDADDVHFALWKPKDAVQRMFDDRTLGVVAVRADTPWEPGIGFLLGYFELRPKR